MSRPNNTPEEVIDRLLDGQRSFFATGATRDLKFRLQQLQKLRAAILRNEDAIADALRSDLHKSAEETWLTETSIVLQEIGAHLRHLRRWARPHSVASSLAILPSRSRILHEPTGVSLIIAPWNYPLQLLLNPLVGAISAGCCAVLKASPYAPATATVVERLVAETFDPRHVCLVQGNRDVNRALLARRFDHIFFTGSPELGKTVMQAAAANLTPVVLELGGKSPCIVARDANIALAARRIAWGKTINAGQTCIAPDYLFIHESVKARFIDEYRRALQAMFGDNIKASPHFGRIVNDRAMARLRRLLDDGDPVLGGDVDDGERYIAPTLLDNVSPDSAVMQEEIFGPILPLLVFSDLAEVVAYVNAHEKPLAFYYFGSTGDARRILRQTSSGGGCINDTLLHIANHRLPFGGVGNSGMGKYHGKDSFEAFSNRRSIVVSPLWFDLKMKYAPFRNFKLIKNILK